MNTSKNRESRRSRASSNEEGGGVCATYLVQRLLDLSSHMMMNLRADKRGRELPEHGHESSVSRPRLELVHQRDLGGGQCTRRERHGLARRGCNSKIRIIPRLMHRSEDASVDMAIKMRVAKFTHCGLRCSHCDCRGVVDNNATMQS